MNTDSKKKRFRDTTLEHDKHVNPPKKMKVDSLLIEVKNKDLVKLKDLVNNGADVTSTGHFSWNNINFQDVPALFAATVSDQESMIDFLVGKYSHLKGETKRLFLQDIEKLSNHQLIELIDVLELVGAACIFHGDTDACKQGWTYWNRALKLREEKALPTSAHNLSEMGRLALSCRMEIVEPRQLKSLSRKKSKIWRLQAFLVSCRILTKYDGFPNFWILLQLQRFSVVHWQTTKLRHSRVFVISLYLFELFETVSFIKLTEDQPQRSLMVIKSTLIVLHKVLKDRDWSRQYLKENNNVLTFDHLMICLNFLCNYQLKFHDSWSNDGSTKQQHLELISDLIHCILKLLMLIPQQQIESRRLKLCLVAYIRKYENGPAKNKPNLLVRECTSKLQVRPDKDFGLIKLLLGLGANPNSVDNQRRSPLHLLATKESLMSYKWTDPKYSTRVKNFTAIVQDFVINDGRYHDDQVDLYGKTALERLEEYSYPEQYPDPQVHQLLSNHLQGVRPLSCLAAKVVKFHRLPCKDLPVTLQSFVLQH